ncbi:hypothetical protein IFM89_013164 [Coptis chinensis]|uniref:Uncharacterized protein n=1 Tax=Coptis chinensis TaxID=261450 RepID=A0A835ICM8_9MAGN|nr:hypothetical protein IFM89_013164 [Coptis chinensis]
MMMIGEGNRTNPTVHIPPWSHFEDPMPEMLSPLPVSGISTSNESEYSPFLLAEALNALQRYLPSNENDSDISAHLESDIPVDAFSCDEFRMYEFKAMESYVYKGSPTSTLFTPPISPPSESPPMSPNTSSLSRPTGANSMNDVLASLRHLQLSKMKSVQMGGSGLLSPRGVSTLRPVFNSLPNTPTQILNRSGIGKVNFWDSVDSVIEEPVMDRVESGRDLRAKMFEKISKENSLDRVDRVGSPGTVTGPGPDVGWVSELVK